MTKDIKDFLPLYLGQRFVLRMDNGEISGQMEFTVDALRASLTSKDYKINPLLLLRPLSSMTEEESFKTLCLNQIFPLEFVGIDDGYISYRKIYTSRASKIYHDYFPVKPESPKSTLYLLSKGFDLFGLIESGLALDTTTLKN